jgi:exodeoxyribonuclease V alpha subunit
MNNMENIEAEITQVIYSKTDSGFAVIKAKDINKNNVFTAVGKILGPKVYEIIKMNGYWFRNEKYGIQFKVLSSEISVPQNLASITNYLGSAFVDAVGPKSARRIVDYFGEQTLDILENDIGKLSLVPGIGPVRVRNIILAWNEQKPFNKAVKQQLLSKNKP